MPFFAHSSGFSMQDGHMYEVGGDCVNIHFAMPTESTGGFGFQCFNDLIERSGQSALQRNYWGNGKSVIWTKVYGRRDRRGSI